MRGVGLVIANKMASKQGFLCMVFNVLHLELEVEDLS